MYFACTPADSHVVGQQLFSAFEKLHAEDSGLRLHAIVDAAFDNRLARRVRKAGVSIAQNSSLAEIKDHLPFVMALNDAPKAEELIDLLAAANGFPMLSFIAAQVAAAPLASALKRFLIARTEDDTRWPLRFADTRILPVLLSELAGASGGSAPPAYCVAWWWLRRDGSLGAFLNRAPNRPDDPAAGKTELALDDEQFARMMNASRADAVISQLHEACPGILDHSLPHENHDRVSRALKLLARKSFDSVELELRWAALALSFQQDLGTIPALCAAIAKAKDGSELLVAIDQLPDEVWVAQEAKS